MKRLSPDEILSNLSKFRLQKYLLSALKTVHLTKLKCMEVLCPTGTEEELMMALLNGYISKNISDPLIKKVSSVFYKDACSEALFQINLQLIKDNNKKVEKEKLRKTPKIVSPQIIVPVKPGRIKEEVPNTSKKTALSREEKKLIAEERKRKLQIQHDTRIIIKTILDVLRLDCVFLNLDYYPRELSICKAYIYKNSHPIFQRLIRNCDLYGDIRFFFLPEFYKVIMDVTATDSVAAVTLREGYIHAFELFKQVSQKSYSTLIADYFNILKKATKYSDAVHKEVMEFYAKYGRTPLFMMLNASAKGNVDKLKYLLFDTPSYLPLSPDIINQQEGTSFSFHEILDALVASSSIIAYPYRNNDDEEIYNDYEEVYNDDEDENVEIGKYNSFSAINPVNGNDVISGYLVIHVNGLEVESVEVFRGKIERISTYDRPWKFEKKRWLNILDQLGIPYIKHDGNITLKAVEQHELQDVIEILWDINYSLDSSMVYNLIQLLRPRKYLSFDAFLAAVKVNSDLSFDEETSFLRLNKNNIYRNLYDSPLYIDPLSYSYHKPEKIWSKITDVSVCEIFDLGIIDILAIFSYYILAHKSLALENTDGDSHGNLPFTAIKNAEVYSSLSTAIHIRISTSTLINTSFALEFLTSIYLSLSEAKKKKFRDDYNGLKMALHAQ